VAEFFEKGFPALKRSMLLAGQVGFTATSCCTMLSFLPAENGQQHLFVYGRKVLLLLVEGGCHPGSVSLKAGNMLSPLTYSAIKKWSV